MTSKVKWSAFILLLAFNIATALFCYYRTSSPMHGTAGFVDVLQLVDNYKLKQDLTSQVSGRLKADQNLIDSLGLRLKLSKPESQDRQIANQDLLSAKYQYENDNSSFSRSISQQVWNRLNPIIYEFSRANHISLLVGATGTGNVLYGDSTIDFTQKLIKYVNERYTGK